MTDRERELVEAIMRALRCADNKHLKAGWRLCLIRRTLGPLVGLEGPDDWEREGFLPVHQPVRDPL